MLARLGRPSQRARKPLQFLPMHYLAHMSRFSRLRPALPVVVVLLSLLFTCLEGAAQTKVSITPLGSAPTPIPGTLLKPTGEGRFPAILIMHDCTGLGPGSSGAAARWAATLVDKGYVVLTPDSYSTREFPQGVCNELGPHMRPVSNPARVNDAYGALRALAQLPYVDSGRIAVLGISYGATVALMLGADLRSPNGPNFAAAVALHPSCANPYRGWSTNRRDGNYGPVVHHFGSYRANAPVLMLLGEKDDWTPAEDCKRLLAASDKGGAPIELKIYPEAHHLFDSTLPLSFDEKRLNFNARNGRGATAGAHPTAWSAAVTDVASFLEKHVRSRPDEQAASVVEERLRNAQVTTRKLDSGATITDVRFAGSLKPNFELGCIPIKDVTSLMNPPALVYAAKQCVRERKYEDAWLLLTTANGFAYYDLKRLADRSTQGARDVLVMNAFSDLARDETEAAQNAARAFLANREKVASYCQDLTKLGPPAYDPQWAILHGVGAYREPRDGHYLTNVDTKALWEEVLKNRCTPQPSN